MRRSRLGAAAMATMALTVAGVGCSANPATPAADEPAAEATSRMRVGLVDFDIITPDTALQPGTVTLKVTNAGQTAHDLRITGEDTAAHLPSLAPGEADTLTLDVAAGQQTLTFWCTLPGHRAQGMETTVAVAGQGPG